MSQPPSQALQVSVFLPRRRKWTKNDGVFVFWHFVSPRPHQGWALPTSSVNLGFLPSVSLSAAEAWRREVSSCRKWPFWSDCLLARRLALRGKTKTRGEWERGGWVLMHLAAIREAYLTVWAQHANTHTHTKGTLSKVHPNPSSKKAHTAHSGKYIHTSWCQHMYQ